MEGVTLLLPDSWIDLNPHLKWGFLFRKHYDNIEKQDPNTTTINKVLMAVARAIGQGREYMPLDLLDIYARDAIHRIYDSTPFAIGDMIKRLGDEINGVVNRFVGTIKAVAQKVWDSIKGVADWVGDNMEIIMVAVMLAGIVTNPALLPIMMKIPGASQVAALSSATTSIYESIKLKAIPLVEEIRRSIDILQIRSLAKIAEDLHRIGLIVSPQYRHKIADLMNITRDISQDVFNDTSTILNAFAITQMAVFDVSSLLGESSNVAQSRMFNNMQRTLNMVNINANGYARNPGSFWYDVQTTIISPLYEDSYILNQSRRTFIENIAGGVGRVDSRVSDLNTRFGEYLKESSGLIDADVRRNLRQFKLETTDPLVKTISSLNAYVQSEVAEFTTDVVTVKTELEDVRRTAKKNKELLQSPNILTGEEKEAQYNRFYSIIDSIYARIDSEQTDEPVIEGSKVGSIIDQIGKE
jgi:hypothetical protein